MCGIIGYSGYRNARNILIQGLKKLEYRGYDSSGISILNKKIITYKEVGHVNKLIKKVPKLDGNIGIIHNRWATHGKICIKNAHPHISNNKKFSLVHNGIIENYAEIKDRLIKKGYVFLSETDSEVIIHLIDDKYEGDLRKAVYEALNEVQGYYAIIVMCSDHPNTLIGARKGCPLVVGHGRGENFLSSDITPIIKYTDVVTYLHNGDICEITNVGCRIFDSNNNPIKRVRDVTTYSADCIDKMNYDHYMLKEIYEQENAIKVATNNYIKNNTIIFGDKINEQISKNPSMVNIVACGTSYHAGLIGKYLIEGLARIPVRVEMSSEYSYYGVYNRNALSIGISQSGETYDTLSAIQKSIDSGCDCLGITNIRKSSITRLCGNTILTHCTPEIGVAATKTFIVQVFIMLLIALKLALSNKSIKIDKYNYYINEIRKIPNYINYSLNQVELIKSLANKLSDYKNIIFVGRGLGYPLSMEGALKLKEISYIHSSAYCAGELKHGPFALLSKDVPVIAIMNHDKTYDKMIANVEEIKARNSPIVEICSDEDKQLDKYTDLINYPRISKELSYFPIIVLLQLIAYHIANKKGCSIDKPRNLAKSVTVE